MEEGDWYGGLERDENAHSEYRSDDASVLYPTDLRDDDLTVSKGPVEEPGRDGGGVILTHSPLHNYEQDD